MYLIEDVLRRKWLTFNCHPVGQIFVVSKSESFVLLILFGGWNQHQLAFATRPRLWKLLVQQNAS